jgi:hypothetical protein
LLNHALVWRSKSFASTIAAIIWGYNDKSDGRKDRCGENTEPKQIFKFLYRKPRVATPKVPPSKSKYWAPKIK